jgi:protease-4
MSKRAWIGRATAGLAVVSGVALGAACDGRPSQTSASAPAARASKSISLDAPALAEIDLARGVPEARSTSLFGTTTRRSYVDLVRLLRALGEGGEASSAPKGVFVRLGTATVGLSRAHEIGALLGRLRKDKPVVCHADEYDNATLLLASRACSKLWVSPAGGVESIGIAAQLIYANRLLERLHIAVDFLQIGKYKGAQETFTRDGPSPEARSSLEGALRGMRAAWLGGIADGRGKPALRDLVEDGPFTPDEAVAKGLVDAVGYPDEARDDAKKLAGAERTVTRFGGSEGPPGASRGLVGMLRAVAGSTHGGAPHVAIVPAIGSITMNPSSSLLGGGDGINEHDLGRILTRLTNDGSTKAVVLRIDSPGGSALASDLLWKKLMKLRAEKPLVVSVGDMAASGGYYLSCAANKIVVEPTSIVGSIGVVGGKLAVGRALDEVGVHAETIAAAPDPGKAARASYMSAITPWDDPTREKVRASMQAIYDLFVKRIAEGRGATVEQIAPSAEGRIFGGVEAKERGLVDEIGGLSEALDLAIKLAGLPKDAPVDVVGHESALFDLLDESDGAAGSEAAAGEAALAGARQAAREAALPAAFREMLPGASAFVGSLAPLLAGERTLCAMPFGLTVR